MDETLTTSAVVLGIRRAFAMTDIVLSDPSMQEGDLRENALTAIYAVVDLTGNLLAEIDPDFDGDEWRHECCQALNREEFGCFAMDQMIRDLGR